jgi:hypothetical protein
MATLGSGTGRERGDEGVGVDGGGETVTVVGVVVCEKMAASCFRAVSCSWPTGAKGAAGVGCLRAATRSKAACRVASAEEVRGMRHEWGKNSTVLEIRSAAVEVM